MRCGDCLQNRLCAVVFEPAGGSKAREAGGPPDNRHRTQQMLLVSDRYRPSYKQADLDQKA